MRPVDTLGLDGVYRDPLWRVEVVLTPLERDLLRQWSVRRLAWVAHAGAAAITTTQSYSRLEHSLGLLALVAHFAPDDQLARAGALLHDVGHLPLSHTFEGVAGLDHHRLGADRIRALATLLGDHGLDAEDVIMVVDGLVPSVLHGPTGGVRLDHVESFLRSGQAHGRTEELPHRTLSRLRLLDGAVDTEAETAATLRRLITAEAASQTSDQNVVATAVVRHLSARLLAEAAALDAITTLTDAEWWVRLLQHPATAADAETFRRHPTGWRAIMIDEDEPLPAGAIEHRLSRLYLEPPLVDGVLVPFDPTTLPQVPRRYAIVPNVELGAPVDRRRSGA